jgi:ferrochelatase
MTSADGSAAGSAPGSARYPSKRTGVLVLSYGTPGSPADVEAYYTHVRRGNPPSDVQLADLRRRYDSIGGVSPLSQRTAEQAAGIEAALEALAPGRFHVTAAAKHASPYIEDGVEALASSGVSDIVALVLAPHYSALSVGEYLQRAQAAAEACGVSLHGVRSWHLEASLIAMLAKRLREALALTGVPPESSLVLVSAHSLPSRVLAMGDPYPDQLGETAEAVARAAGVTRWKLAWQSAGRTPEPWLGPDILEEIRGAAAQGIAAVVVCPAGFTSDHLEVLYDLDIEARELAGSLGVAFSRTASLNDDRDLCELLAQVVIRTAEGCADTKARRA